MTRGATKPPPQERDSSFLKMLAGQSPTKKGSGLGNAVMGGTFKSIFLIQGRSQTKQATRKTTFLTVVDNDDLSAIEKVLLNLHERPETKPEEIFKEDIYTCARFAKDPIMAERLY